MADQSNNAWVVWDTRPGPVLGQGLQDAYMKQDDRVLPKLTAGWETRQRDRTTLPYSSYFYDGEMRMDPAMPVTYDQLEWFAEPAKAHTDVRQLDFATVRQSQFQSEDGLPLNGGSAPTTGDASLQEIKKKAAEHSTTKEDAMRRLYGEALGDEPQGYADDFQYKDIQDKKRKHAADQSSVMDSFFSRLDNYLPSADREKRQKMEDIKEEEVKEEVKEGKEVNGEMQFNPAELLQGIGAPPITGDAMNYMRKNEESALMIRRREEWTKKMMNQEAYIQSVKEEIVKAKNELRSDVWHNMFMALTGQFSASATSFLNDIRSSDNNQPLEATDFKIDQYEDLTKDSITKTALSVLQQYEGRALGERDMKTIKKAMQLVQLHKMKWEFDPKQLEKVAASSDLPHLVKVMAGGVIPQMQMEDYLDIVSKIIRVDPTLVTSVYENARHHSTDLNTIYHGGTGLYNEYHDDLVKNNMIGAKATIDSVSRFEIDRLSAFHEFKDEDARVSTLTGVVVPQVSVDGKFASGVNAVAAFNTGVQSSTM